MATLSCGAPAAEVDALRKDVVRLRGEVRDARKEAARAREEVAALNLKAEVHAFLQSDESLKGDGPFPALADRVLRDSREFTYALPAGSVRALHFKTGYKLRVDFVAGSGAAGEIGNRLEVFTKTDSFTPLNVQQSEYGAYVLEEGQALLIRTTEGARGGAEEEEENGKRKKAKGGGARGPSDAAEVLLRYLPASGLDPRRVAYVRLSFLGQAGEGGAGDDGGAAPEGDGGGEESDGGAGGEDGGPTPGGDEGGYDFSDD